MLRPAGAAAAKVGHRPQMTQERLVPRFAKTPFNLRKQGYFSVNVQASSIDVRKETIN
jgi:hypothetical protein